MTTTDKTVTGGELLMQELEKHGARTIFGVPGESYLAALDALVDHPALSFITCRQEGGAAMMADAYARMTGEPGICFVTRGPGATNASAGVHVAFQDSTPMILLIGQVARDMISREAFQEIDYRRMFGQMAKWVDQIDDAARIPEYISRAFHTATSGRPGPVVLALPEDMLVDPCHPSKTVHYRRTETHPGAEQIAELRQSLKAAKRPLVLIGGGGWSVQAAVDVAAFAATNDLPVACSFRCQDYMNNDHPNYVGHLGIGADPGLLKKLKEADWLLVAGPRLGEMTTDGYTRLQVPVPGVHLVHAHPGAEEIGRVYQPSQGINASAGPLMAALKKMDPITGHAWSGWTKEARESYEAFCVPQPTQGDVRLDEIYGWLRDRLPADAVLCNGAGNYAGWGNRFLRHRQYRSQLAPTSGTMGYGLPAAVGAKAADPSRPVICFAGDGCFMMHGQELATAVQFGLNIVIIVINNSMYGTIRMHQEREFPTRVSGTALKNPDFAAYAEAFGAHGEKVTKTADFEPAFERAMAEDRPALIEVVIDPEVISPATTLAKIRETAQTRKLA